MTGAKLAWGLQARRGVKKGGRLARDVSGVHARGEC